MKISPLDQDESRFTLIGIKRLTVVRYRFANPQRLNRVGVLSLLEYRPSWLFKDLASSLAQGFPVTGADSRTAVNNAMGGKTQMVGLIAGGAMLLVLLYMTAPLAYVPTTALAAVILISAIGLFELADLRLLYRMSYREFLMSVATTLGALLLGVLPGDLPIRI